MSNSTPSVIVIIPTCADRAFRQERAPSTAPHITIVSRPRSHDAGAAGGAEGGGEEGRGAGSDLSGAAHWRARVGQRAGGEEEARGGGERAEEGDELHGAEDRISAEAKLPVAVADSKVTKLEGDGAWSLTKLIRGASAESCHIWKVSA